MSLLSGLVGIGKVASNFLGGGAGDSKNTKQNSTSTTSQTGTSTSSSNASQSNNSRQFSDNMLKVLELVSKDALGSTAQGASALRDRLTEVQATPIEFDSDKFVRGVMDAATSTIGSKLTSDVNGLVSSTGGSTGGNSAAALLAGKLRNEASANLAGVNSSAQAQAAEIESNLAQSKTSQLTGITQGLDASLASLLSALKGGETQIDITGKQSEASTTKQTGTNTVSGTQKEVQPFNWAKGFGNIFNLDTDK